MPITPSPAEEGGREAIYCRECGGDASGDPDGVEFNEHCYAAWAHPLIAQIARRDAASPVSSGTDESGEFTVEQFDRSVSEALLAQCDTLLDPATKHEVRDNARTYILDALRGSGYEITDLRSALAASRAREQELRADSERLDWLEREAEADEQVTIGFTEAWSEPGEYGSVLSSGPREFWLSDNGYENGPTLRAAIDAAREYARTLAAPTPSSGEDAR